MPNTPENNKGQIPLATSMHELLSKARIVTTSYDAAQIQFNEEQARADRQMKQIAFMLAQRLLGLGGDASDIVVRSEQPIKHGNHSRKISTAFRPVDNTIRIITIDRRLDTREERVAADFDASHLPGFFANYGLKIVDVLSGRITGIENKQRRI